MRDKYSDNKVKKKAANLLPISKKIQASKKSEIPVITDLQTL